MGWLSGWSYAKEISLTGQTGAGTLYQVDLDIGASAGGDFHLEGHCTNFPQDIEVTDDNGTTLIDFWIEDTAVDPIKLWVEVADDLGSNQKVWVYYGKSGASTNSDIGETFLFSDDFPGSSLDTNIWDTTSIGNMVTTVSGGELRCQCSTGSGKIYSKAKQYGSPVATRFRWKGWTTTHGYTDAGFKNNDASVDQAMWVARQDTAQWRTDTRNENVGTNTVEGTTGSGTYQNWDILWKSGSEVEYFRADASQQVTTTNVPDESNLHFMITSIYQSPNAADAYFDWVLVRKYNSPEPGFASAGSEQSAPSVGNPYWYYEMIRRRN